MSSTKKVRFALPLVMVVAVMEVAAPTVVAVVVLMAAVVAAVTVAAVMSVPVATAAVVMAVVAVVVVPVVAVAAVAVAAVVTVSYGLAQSASNEKAANCPRQAARIIASERMALGGPRRSSAIGLTLAGGINRTVWPSACSSRDQLV